MAGNYAQGALDEPPLQWFECDACDGSGEVVTRSWGHEHGCGHGHWMEEGRPCGKCDGAGGWLDEMEADQSRPI